MASYFRATALKIILMASLSTYGAATDSNPVSTSLPNNLDALNQLGILVNEPLFAGNGRAGGTRPKQTTQPQPPLNPNEHPEIYGTPISRVRGGNYQPGIDTFSIQQQEPIDEIRNGKLSRHFETNDKVYLYSHPAWADSGWVPAPDTSLARIDSLNELANRAMRNQDMTDTSGFDVPFLPSALPPEPYPKTTQPQYAKVQKIGELNNPPRIVNAGNTPSGSGMATINIMKGATPLQGSDPTKPPEPISSDQVYNEVQKAYSTLNGSASDSEKSRAKTNLDSIEHTFYSQYNTNTPDWNKQYNKYLRPLYGDNGSTDRLKKDNPSLYNDMKNDWAQITTGYRNQAADKVVGKNHLRAGDIANEYDAWGLKNFGADWKRK